jgi:hypothetical protein
MIDNKHICDYCSNIPNYKVYNISEAQLDGSKDIVTICTECIKLHC